MAFQAVLQGPATNTCAHPDVNGNCASSLMDVLTNEGWSPFASGSFMSSLVAASAYLFPVVAVMSSIPVFRCVRQGRGGWCADVCAWRWCTCACGVCEFVCLSASPCLSVSLCVCLQASLLTGGVRVRVPCQHLAQHRGQVQLYRERAVPRRLVLLGSRVPVDCGGAAHLPAQRPQPVHHFQQVRCGMETCKTSRGVC